MLSKGHYTHPKIKENMFIYAANTLLLFMIGCIMTRLVLSFVTTFGDKLIVSETHSMYKDTLAVEQIKHNTQQ